jgi:hypothetical protein
MFRPVRRRAVLRTAPDLNALVTIRAANKTFLVTKILVVVDPVGQCDVALRLLPKSGENLIFRRRSS